MVEASGTPLSIGAGINANDVHENIHATLDEVWLYNRALTPAELERAIR